jgi:hypothetical protein
MWTEKKNRWLDKPTGETWLEKTKKLKFYLSLMSTTLFVMSWVEYCGDKSTQLNSWQKNKVLNSTHSIHVWSWSYAHAVYVTCYFSYMLINENSYWHIILLRTGCGTVKNIFWCKCEREI